MKAIIPLILLASSAAIAQQLDDLTVEITPCHSGDWVTPESIGEGYNLNVLPNGNATFYFYTYELNNGRQLYYTGVLEKTDEFPRCLQGELYHTSGGALFSESNPANVRRTPEAIATLCMGGDLFGVVAFSMLDNVDQGLTRDFVRLTPKQGSSDRSDFSIFPPLQTGRATFTATGFPAELSGWCPTGELLTWLPITRRRETRPHRPRACSIPTFSPHR